MTTEFNMQETMRITEVCKACENYGGGYGYCQKFRTDSILFKYNLCNKLKKICN